MMTNELKIRISEYLDHLRAGYAAWHDLEPTDDPIKLNIRKEMIERYNNGLYIHLGSKYIKVMSGTGVHSFIVIKPDGKFRYGDILKAASWAAPARNFTRGNVIEKKFDTIGWTGA